MLQNVPIEKVITYIEKYLATLYSSGSNVIQPQNLPSCTVGARLSTGNVLCISLSLRAQWAMSPYLLLTESNDWSEDDQ